MSSQLLLLSLVKTTPIQDPASPLYLATVHPQHAPSLNILLQSPDSLLSGRVLTVMSQLADIQASRILLSRVLAAHFSIAVVRNFVLLFCRNISSVYRQSYLFVNVLMLDLHNATMQQCPVYHLFQVTKCRLT